MMSKVMESERRSISSNRPDMSASASAKNPNSSQNRPDTPRTGGDESAADTRSSVESVSEAISIEFPDDPVLGWPTLASLMAKTPNCAAFPRFRDINIKSLLYYQAQLTALRKQLHNQEYIDTRSQYSYAEYADLLVKDKDSEQFKLITEIRTVLKEYNEALLQYSRISALPEPDPYDMRSLTMWMSNERGGDFHIRSIDGLQNTWGDLHVHSRMEASALWRQIGRLVWTLIRPRPPSLGDLDLVSTGPRREVDSFTRWAVFELFPLLRNLVRPRNKRIPSDAENGAPLPPWRKTVTRVQTLEDWSARSGLKLLSRFSTVVLCLLPVGAITALSQLHGNRDLLLCLAGLTALFALGTTYLFPNSTKDEMFRATIAFLAVMVVFISTPVVVLLPGSPSSTPLPSLTPTPSPQ